MMMMIFLTDINMYITDL